MGTVVYQGFQSYLDEPRALRLRLSSPNPHFSQPFGLSLKCHLLDSPTPDHNTNKPTKSSKLDDEDSNPTQASGGWTFLQSLSSTSEKDKTYTLSPSSKTLSDESLALCTENLGSETGSDVTEDDLLLLSLPDVQSKNLEGEIEETRTFSSQELRTKKRNEGPSDIPPPLTTMRGFQCIQMRPYREDGRLVMTAVKAPPRNRCLQADRSNGRLRLSIFKDFNYEEDNEEEEPSEIEDYDEEEEEEEMGMEIGERLRSCVEAESDRENRGVLNWESFCVSTS